MHFKNIFLVSEAKWFCLLGGSCLQVCPTHNYPASMTPSNHSMWKHNDSHVHCICIFIHIFINILANMDPCSWIPIFNCRLQRINEAPSDILHKQPEKQTSSPQPNYTQPRGYHSSEQLESMTTSVLSPASNTSGLDTEATGKQSPPPPPRPPLPSGFVPTPPPPPPLAAQEPLQGPYSITQSDLLTSSPLRALSKNSAVGVSKNVKVVPFIYFVWYFIVKSKY